MSDDELRCVLCCVVLCVQVSVFDANTAMKNTLIGLYEFDFMDIYFKENHEVRLLRESDGW